MLTSFRSGPCGVGTWHVDGVMKTRWQRTRDVEAWFLHHRFDTAGGSYRMLPVKKMQRKLHHTDIKSLFLSRAHPSQTSQDRTAMRRMR